MAAPPPIGKRLATVLVPTFVQGLCSVVVALLILVYLQLDSVLKLTGIGEAAIGAAREQLHDRFHVIATSAVVANLALVTFWAAVGLVAYLACWSVYNLFIGARNEVTLTTEYTNRGHWRGHIETLALKTTGALGLVALLALLKPGVALWLALAAPALSNPTAISVSSAVVAVFGLAFQLYAVLALVLVTFTPWYRSETFTN